MVDTIGKSHRHPVGRHYAVAAPSYTSAWRQAAGLVTVLSDRLRFKTHNIGSLATTINRGYCGRDTRLNCGVAPFRVVIGCGKNHAETGPQETPHHPERPTRSTRNGGPLFFVLE